MARLRKVELEEANIMVIELIDREKKSWFWEERRCRELDGIGV